MDRPQSLWSYSDFQQLKTQVYPPPVTSAYVNQVGGSGMKGFSGKAEVEDACRSFENYLVEMIVEKGNVRDLMDIEELLCCWKNLKSPVFIDLVSRFYGELRTDLFSADEKDCATDSSN